MKQALLVVSFGTSHLDTLENTISIIERDMAAAFPGWEVRRAFTSGMIIQKLKQRDGLVVDTVDEALDRMAEEGYDIVVVQPTHIMNGAEYDKLTEKAAPYQKRFRHLVLGAPLLTSIEDYQKAADALLSEYPVPKPGHALVLMGHGTEHFANSVYPALEYVFHDKGRQDICLGTVEGYPRLEQVMSRLSEQKVSSVTLIPLMVVAGDHVKNDMAGSEELSWKNRLEVAGYQVQCVMRGMGESAEIRARFVDHARAAMTALA